MDILPKDQNAADQNDLDQNENNQIDFFFKT